MIGFPDPANGIWALDEQKNKKIQDWKNGSAFMEVERFDLLGRSSIPGRKVFKIDFFEPLEIVFAITSIRFT
jgi:hypothetical protein